MINVKEIKIKDLIPFEGSPFEFREDEGFTQLFYSISESGVFSPIVVCERDFNSGDVSFFEQMIDRMPDVSSCIEYTTESIQNSITNPTLQSQTLTVQLTSTCNASPTQTETRSLIGITIDCQE